MAHPQIMARQLRRPIIGLGFAGNARMELALRFINRIGPRGLHVDCLPNMVSIRSTNASGLLDRMRQGRPETPSFCW